MPKTATTMLQRYLFPEHSQIDYLGKFAQGKAGFPDAEVQALNAALAARSGDRKPALPSLRERTLRSVNGGRVPVWSKEGMSGGTVAQKRRQAELLHRVFGPCRVLISLREPLTFVEALYFQQLRGFNFENFSAACIPGIGRAPRYFDVNEWLESIWWLPSENQLGHLKFGDTAEIYADVFGKENVGLFIFEELKIDSACYLRRLCAFLGIDAEEGTRLAAGKRANDRLSPDTIERIKKIQSSSWMAWKFRLGGNRLRRQMLGLSKADRAASRPAARAELSLAWRTRILELGCQQTRKIARQWDLPLNDYGYPIPHEQGALRAAA
jgi:hypothetical protein